MRFTRMVRASEVVVCSFLLAQPGGAQRQPSRRADSGPSKNSESSRTTSSDDWPMYRHDKAGTGYSPLSQITVRNVAQLAQVWTYPLQSDAPVAAPAGGRGGPAGPNSEATPIVVSGVMYLPAANRVAALDPETGKERWQYRVAGGAPSRRGVAFWPGDGTAPPRIVFTVGRRLIELDAASGTPVPTFGRDGEVDMIVPYNSVPFVHGNVVIVGANTPPGAPGGVGNARAFDVR